MLNSKNNFTDEDKNNLIDFLNYIAKRAEFNKMTTEDIIAHFKLLQKMQLLVQKIHDNILEIKEVRQNPPPVPKED